MNSKGRPFSPSQPSLDLEEGIIEVLSIPPFEELPWLFEMQRGRRLSISLMANQEVDIVVCDESDYDAWVDAGMETDRPAFGFLESNGATRHRLQFRSPVSGLVVVLVVNTSGTEAELAISLVEDQRSLSAPLPASQ